MRANMGYSCHIIANIKHSRQLSLQLMTNRSLTCNYRNACLDIHKVLIVFPEKIIDIDIFIKILENELEYVLSSSLIFFIAYVFFYLKNV